jgi:ubiquinone/menaquinone biosynthesis C-methylase UbiE
MFGIVVCAFSLCAIPDHRRALAEMIRVLRPDGLLLLADHVASSNPVVRAGQRLAELVSVRWAASTPAAARSSCSPRPGW